MQGRKRKTRMIKHHENEKRYIHKESILRIVRSAVKIGNGGESRRAADGRGRGRQGVGEGAIARVPCAGIATAAAIGGSGGSVRRGDQCVQRARIRRRVENRRRFGRFVADRVGARRVGAQLVLILILIHAAAVAFARANRPAAGLGRGAVAARVVGFDRAQLDAQRER